MKLSKLQHITEVNKIVSEQLLIQNSSVRNTFRPDSVETEIRQQVRRLHHHPSIVIWATNNEVEVAAAQGWYGPNASKIEYRRRFLDSVAKIMMKNEGPSNRSIGYIPRQVLFSSPSNAAASTDTWGIDSNPQV